MIVAYCQADKMLGLVALQVDVVFEAVSLATSSPRHYINKNVNVGAIMLPLIKSNEQFQMQYSVIYSDWDVLRSNGDKCLPQISYDLF